jgi:hypothetical protein
MAAPIAYFISLETPGRSAAASGALAVVRRVAIIAVMRIVAVIHVAAEFIGTVKPWANADESASVKPFWTVVAIGCAAIRLGVIVTVRTRRFNSNTEADLSLSLGRTCRDEECGSSSKRKKHKLFHELSWQWLRPLSFSQHSESIWLFCLNLSY